MKRNSVDGSLCQKEDAPEGYDETMVKLREFTLNVDVQVENLPAHIRDELDSSPGISFLLDLQKDEPEGHK